jgi:serine/threonine-protein kinase RsbW
MVVVDATELPPLAASVAAARRFIRESLGPFGLACDRMDDLVIAVSEAFTNAIDAYTERALAGTVTIRSLAGVGDVTVEVEDRAGGGFDFASWKPRPALASGHLGQERGWGIQLMLELVDRASFESTPDGTRVRLLVAR